MSEKELKRHVVIERVIKKELTSERQVRRLCGNYEVLRSSGPCF
jgi:hypothetical protein